MLALGSIFRLQVSHMPRVPLGASLCACCLPRNFPPTIH